MSNIKSLVHKSDLQVSHVASVSLGEEAVSVCQDAFDQVLV